MRKLTLGLVSRRGVFERLDQAAVQLFLRQPSVGRRRTRILPLAATLLLLITEDWAGTPAALPPPLAVLREQQVIALLLLPLADAAGNVVRGDQTMLPAQPRVLFERFAEREECRLVVGEARQLNRFFRLDAVGAHVGAVVVRAGVGLVDGEEYALVGVGDEVDAREQDVAVHEAGAVDVGVVEVRVQVLLRVLLADLEVENDVSRDVFTALALADFGIVGHLA